MAEADTSAASQSNSVLGLTFDNPQAEGEPAASSDAPKAGAAAPSEAEGAVSNAETKPPATGQEPDDKSGIVKEINTEGENQEAKEPAPSKTEAAPAAEEAKSTASEQGGAETVQSPKEKKKRNPGYINPDRVKTGGVRDKPSADELAERMERIRLQNAKILAKREQADKDAQAYEETMAKEREAAKRRREVQNQINSQRQANAERKLGNRAGREWDAEKAIPEPNAGRGRGYDRGFIPRGRVLRGGFRGAPRGAFRGRGGPPGAPSTSAPPPEPATPSGPGPTPAEAAALKKS